MTNVEPADEHQTGEEVEDVEHALVDNAVTEKENVSACKSDERSQYITDIDDEICKGEEYYDPIDPGTAMACLICKVEHFPVNYLKGDKVDTYAVCRWHLGISRCGNCGKNP